MISFSAWISFCLKAVICSVRMITKVSVSIFRPCMVDCSFSGIRLIDGLDVTSCTSFLGEAGGGY